MSCCSGWWMWILPMVILWWLFASAIVFVTWNRVITAVTAAKKMQYSHALLLVFAFGVLCGPHHAQNCWKGGGCNSRFEMQEHQNLKPPL